MKRKLKQSFAGFLTHLAQVSNCSNIFIFVLLGKSEKLVFFSDEISFGRTKKVEYGQVKQYSSFILPKK